MIKIAGIVNDSIVDGPGLRMCIFTQGCDKSCEGCHNPEARLLSGGEDYPFTTIFEKIKKNPLLSGITFSGGEPLIQAKELIPLAELIKQEDLDLALYTGDTFEEILQKNDEDVLTLLSMCDILIDGPFILAEKSLTLKFRGSTNQRILDCQKSLEAKEAILTDDPGWG